MTDPNMPPQPTYSGGSAVQTATDASGDQWKYDDQGPGQDGAWVNLKTGEALSPAQFSQKAGRPGNTGANTTMLADQMSGRPVVMAPFASPQGGTWSPEAVARLAVQRPEPSIVTPPPQQAVDDWETRETMAAAQRMGAPLNQAMQAVESQRRYQAQRGYQADLKGGMSAADAMTKWGPMLFAGPRGAGSMPRQPVPPIAPGASPQTYTDPKTGNTFYLQGNKWVHVPRPGAGIPTVETTTERFPQVTGKPAVPAVPPQPPVNILGLNIPFTGKAGSPGSPEVPTQPARTVTRRAPVLAPPPVPPPTTTSATNAAPVIRLTKDGRRAKFDPATKQFLGYAD